MQRPRSRNSPRTHTKEYVMSLHATSPLRRILMTSGALLAASTLIVSCTSNEPESKGNGDSTAAANAGSSNDDPGDEVVIGFSGPQADHGWLAAINSAAQAEAEKYEDVDFRQAEGTNDANLQISHIETVLNDKVDAVDLLPSHDVALTDASLR